MDKNAETPPTGNRFETLRAQEYIDITNGFPFSNSQDFYDFIWDSAEYHETTRFPIVSLRQTDGSTRVYMLLKNTQNGKQDHHSLLGRLGLLLEQLEQDASPVAFTTSLEGHGYTKPEKGSYLEFTAKNEYDDKPETKYISLGKGSDLFPLQNSQFTNEGKQTLTEIFGRLNVQVRTN
ncbi:MAG: hypothetical protein ABI425_02415 [Patescibacteria group bacterium]